MDNFAHSLAGWALGQAGLKSKSRKGLAALILGANMPDIDVFLGWVPWAPLATHRGFTHGVGGVMLMPPLLAGLLWLLDRWQLKRGAVFRSGLPMRFGWLVALAYIGTLTHPLLDLQTTYAVQLLSPFDNRWFHTETLFIVDVWIWSAMCLAIWLSRRREKQGKSWQWPAMAGLAALCLYVGLNGMISLRARAKLPLIVPGRADLVIAGQEPVLFWKRDMVWRQGGFIQTATYDPLSTTPLFSEYSRAIPDNMGEPLVQRAIRTDPAMTRFLRWSLLPYAVIKRDGCEATVSLGDARFGLQMVRAPMRREAVLTLDKPGCKANRKGK